jgi:sugar lactone lactonase YvrE
MSQWLRCGLFALLLSTTGLYAQSIVTTVAGSGTSGRLDGPAATAQFNFPGAVAVDGQGTVYVADTQNHGIRRISAQGVVSTVAGNGGAGYFDAWSGTLAAFNSPNGLALDARGVLYIADTGNGSIRQLLPAGGTATLAGNGTGGYQDGLGPAAQFLSPIGLTLGAQKTVYVCDASNYRIRQVDSVGGVTTLAGSGVAGVVDGPAPAARFREVHGITRDAAGNLYIADRSVHRIRRLTPGGIVSTVAGTGVPGYTDGAAATAQFNGPVGLAYDGRNGIYISEREGHRLRRLDLGSGTVSTVAGTGTAGYADGAGTAALFNRPQGLYWAATEQALYVADASNHRIRKITGLPLAASPTREEMAAQPALHLYPNPASSPQVTLLVAGWVHGASVEILDCMGRRVKLISSAPAVRGGFEVDVRGWAPGLYLCRLLTKGRPATVARLIIQ